MRAKRAGKYELYLYVVNLCNEFSFYWVVVKSNFYVSLIEFRDIV